MKYFAGLDVSLEESAICIVDETGEVIRAAKVDSEPAAIVDYLAGTGLPFGRVGLEACPLSQWLYDGLAGAGLPVVCIEVRHLKAALSAMTNKTDRNDARGIAQTRVRELVEDRPALLAVAKPRLRVCAVLLEEYRGLDRLVHQAARHDEVCQRLMTLPGVGAVVALTYRAAVDVPARFSKSKALGAHFGLVPRKHQSGELDRTGRISKVGDVEVRCALYEAASVMLSRVVRFSTLKAWAMRVARRQGLKKAKVALARKLAVVLHRIWVDGTTFRWSLQPTPAQA